jgi:hypothetical protein
VTFDPGTGSVPPSPAADSPSTASAAGPASPVPQPLSATVQPVAPAPQVVHAKQTKSGGRAGAGTLVLAVGLIVAVGGVAFAVGRVTTPAASAATGARAFGANAGSGFPSGSFAPGVNDTRGLGGFGAIGGITGTVTAITADTLTIQIGGASGRTLEIPLTSSTTYHTEVPATTADVSVGAQVTVRTERNAAANGQVPLASGVPGANGAAPGGAGVAGAPDFAIGTATDVTVIPPSGQ